MQQPLNPRWVLVAVRPLLWDLHRHPSGWTQVLRQMSVEDYIQGSGSYFEKDDFFESEISRKVDVFGSIAHAFSTYETRREPDAIPVARGINSLQAMHDDKGWRIVSIFWMGESDRNPIPEQYLP